MTRRGRSWSQTRGAIRGIKAPKSKMANERSWVWTDHAELPPAMVSRPTAQHGYVLREELQQLKSKGAGRSKSQQVYCNSHSLP